MSDIDPDSELGTLWERLLSRQPEQVRAVFFSLPEVDQAAVISHLKKMAEGAGWHKEQRTSALIALQSIEENRDGS